MKQMIVIGLILMLIFGVLPALAQQNYTNTSGIEVSVPSGWNIFDVEGGIIIFSPDESAGAWFQAFYASPPTIGDSCLPIVLPTFSDALAIDNLSIDPEAPTVAYVDYDDGNGIGMIVCDIIADTLVIGSALVSARNTYDANWQLVADMYFSVTVDVEQALAGLGVSNTAQTAPALQQSTTLPTTSGSITFDLPTGWTISDTGDVYVLMSDISGDALIYLEQRTHTATMTMQSCLDEFIAELRTIGFADLTVADSGYLEGGQTIYTEFVFNNSSQVGVAACNLDTPQYANLWLITVSLEAFDRLWTTQLDIISSVQFPSNQTTAQQPAVQSPAQTGITAPSANVNDPFAALGGVAQPEQPSAGNNPFAQSGVLGQSPSNLTFTSFIDPTERAFSVDVPQGWAIEGGMYDVFGTKLIFYGMVSPDESVLAFVGQTEILISLQPTPELTQAGYPDGTAIYADNNLYIRVATYQTGAEAARALVEANFATACTTFNITEMRELPEVSGLTPDQTAFVSAGEVAYTCTVEDRKSVV